MAKKATPPKKAVTGSVATVAVTTSSPVRNTPVPKSQAAAPARKVATLDDIALRAYEISISGTGGDEMANWLRAERELRGV